MHPIVRVSSGVMAALFLLAVAVQFNDPDPIRWILIYAGAAAASFMAARGRVPLWLPALVGIVALVWAAFLMPGVSGTVAPSELFREVGMDSPEIEVAREDFGLLLVGLWMIVLIIAARRARRT